jgi:hypothetical protein
MVFGTKIITTSTTSYAIIIKTDVNLVKLS